MAPEVARPATGRHLLRPDAVRRVSAWVRDGATAPLAAVCAVLLLDLPLRSRPHGVAVSGLLDEPAHLLTALVLLRCLTPPLPRRLWPPVLAGSVLIDVDHVPLYTVARGFSVDGGRPPTHSLSLVVLLLLLGLVRRRHATLLLGLGLGVVLHLLRDVATGPGLALVWPVSAQEVLVPYPAYVAVLLAAATVATVRGGGRTVGA